MERSTKMALAMTALFALLCAGCSGSGTSTGSSNNSGSNPPTGTIQGSAK